MNSIDIMKFNADKVNPLILANKDTTLNGEEIHDKAMLDMECMDMIRQCAAQQLVITDDVCCPSPLFILCFVLFCFVLFCFVFLFCFVLFCFVLFCFVFLLLFFNVSIY